MQERLNLLWVAAKKELEDAKSRLRAKEREREDLAEAEGVELKVRATTGPRGRDGTLLCSGAVAWLCGRRAYCARPALSTPCSTI